jgi:hypothetical protein
MGFSIFMFQNKSLLTKKTLLRIVSSDQLKQYQLFTSKTTNGGFYLKLLLFVFLLQFGKNPVDYV